jgi:hypothetical protein
MPLAGPDPRACDRGDSRPALPPGPRTTVAVFDLRNEYHDLPGETPGEVDVLPLGYGSRGLLVGSRGAEDGLQFVHGSRDPLVETHDAVDVPLFVRYGSRDVGGVLTAHPHDAEVLNQMIGRPDGTPGVEVARLPASNCHAKNCSIFDHLDRLV